MMNRSSTAAAIEQLCPKCGFCCNGNLFADVELQRGDDALRLAKLGLPLEEKREGKPAFAQPCACFDGKLCAIYPERPKRCRTFECGLLKRVKEGRLETGAALKIISRSKAQVGKVVRLLGEFDDDDPRLAITKRYSKVMSAPIDLSKGASESRLRGKLMLATGHLMRQLKQDFLE